MMMRVLVFLAFLAVTSGCSAPLGERTQSKPAQVLQSECPDTRPASAVDGKALQALSGKRIAMTCVYGIQGEDRARVEYALRPRIGEPFDSARTRDDVYALMNDGRFDDVDVAAVTRGEELALLYRVTMGVRIAQVAFRGATVLQNEGLETIRVRTDRFLSIGKVYEAATLVRNEYHRRGYRQVAVDVVKDDSIPSYVRVTIFVKEGPQSKFGPIHVKGVSERRAAELRKAVQIEEGTPFVDEKVQQAVFHIQDANFELGFLNTRVEVSAGEAQSDGSLPVTFDVVEGDVFRFGSVKVGSPDGAPPTKMPPVKLRSKSGAIASRAAVHHDVEAITKAFAAEGRKVAVVPRRELNAKKRTLDVVFEVAPAP
jgi:outer membrane protein assembly factor BamA